MRSASNCYLWSTMCRLWRLVLLYQSFYWLHLCHFHAIRLIGWSPFKRIDAALIYSFAPLSVAAILHPINCWCALHSEHIVWKLLAPSSQSVLWYVDFCAAFFLLFQLPLCHKTKCFSCTCGNNGKTVWPVADAGGLNWIAITHRLFGSMWCDAKSVDIWRFMQSSPLLCTQWNGKVLFK